MHNVLKSLLATAYWSRHESGIGWSKFLLESGLRYLYVYYAHALLGGQASTPCHNFISVFFYKI